MTRRILILIVLLAVLCPRTPIFAERLSDSRTLRETIAFEGADNQRLIVDNIWGSVVVRGYDGDTVEMVAEETVRARTKGERTIIEIPARHPRAGGREVARPIPSRL